MFAKSLLLFLSYIRLRKNEIKKREEAEEREKTGIKGLKVGFNKVFGYFIEVTKSNLSRGTR